MKRGQNPGPGIQPRDLDEGQRMCVAAAREMRNVIDGLLVLAWKNSPGAGMRFSTFDIAELVASAIDQSLPLAGEREVRLSVRLNPAEIRGDHAALSVLVAYLVSQAIQNASHQGTVHLETGLEEGEAALKIRVERPRHSREPMSPDPGPGCSAWQTGREASAHRGLGLAIATLLVESHGGRVTVEMRRDESVTVAVLLPAP